MIKLHGAKGSAVIGAGGTGMTERAEMTDRSLLAILFRTRLRPYSAWYVGLTIAKLKSHEHR